MSASVEAASKSHSEELASLRTASADAVAGLKQGHLAEMEAESKSSEARINEVRAEMVTRTGELAADLDATRNVRLVCLGIL